MSSVQGKKVSEHAQLFLYLWRRSLPHFTLSVVMDIGKCAQSSTRRMHFPVRSQFIAVQNDALSGASVDLVNFGPSHTRRLLHT